MKINRRDGVALILTIFVISVLSAVVLEFSDESMQETILSAYSRDSALTLEICRSLIDIERARLEDDENRNMDSFKEEWAEMDILGELMELPEGCFMTMTVQDEQGKLNINMLLDPHGKDNKERIEQFSRFMDILKLDKKLLNALLDWLDPDDIERLDGAEDFYYSSLPIPYSCGNQRFLTPFQIFLVKGFEKLYENLLDYITIYSDGKININTAPKEVLMSLSDRIDESIAKNILEYREDKEFEDINELKEVPGIDSSLFSEIRPYITVKSNTFSLIAKSRCKDTENIIRAVLKRKNKGSDILYWRVM